MGFLRNKNKLEFFKPSPVDNCCNQTSLLLIRMEEELDYYPVVVKYPRYLSPEVIFMNLHKIPNWRKRKNALKRLLYGLLSKYKKEYQKKQRTNAIPKLSPHSTPTNPTKFPIQVFVRHKYDGAEEENNGRTPDYIFVVPSYLSTVKKESLVIVRYSFPQKTSGANLYVYRYDNAQLERFKNMGYRMAEEGNFVMSNTCLSGY